MTGQDMPGVTLGERLEAVARVITARYQAQSAWTSLAVPALRRAAQLIESSGGRFERHEAAAGPADFPAELPGLPGGSADPYRAAVGRAFPMPAAATGPGPASAAGSGLPPVTADGTEAAPGAALPADVRSRLVDIAGPGAGLLRVRTGAVADSLSRAHRADAVTVGADVFFRDGEFRPDDRDGFALLAHEAAHVSALLDPGMAGRQAAGGDVGPAERAAEDAALATERAARQRFGRPGTGLPVAAYGGSPSADRRPPGAADLAGPYPGTGQPPAQARPRPASVDRDNSAAGAPPFDVEALRRSLIADLARQLRAEFERGG
jgi:hypothetical protein